MERVTDDREQDLASFNTEQLTSFYQTINTELARSLLSGARLDDQQQKIRMLNKISGELNRRKAFTGPARGSNEFMDS